MPFLTAAVRRVASWRPVKRPFPPRWLNFKNYYVYRREILIPAIIFYKYLSFLSWIHTEYTLNTSQPPLNTAEYTVQHYILGYLLTSLEHFCIQLYSGGVAMYSVCIQYVFRTKKFRPMKRASLVLFFSLGRVGSSWNNAKSTQKAPL